MRLRVGTSDRAVASEAVALAARDALAGAVAPAMALVFCTLEHDADVVAAAVNDALGALPWAGMVTPAVLHGRRIEHGVAIGVLDSDAIRVRVGVSGPLSQGTHDAGRRATLAALSDMALPPPDRSRAMLLFVDSARGDATDVLRGAVSVAGAGIAWCGGGTGPGGALFAGGHALRDHVVAIALDGDSRIGSGVRHGFQPIGPPTMVTRVAGSLVEQLEHRPAIETYRAAAEERGETAEDFVSFATTHPLGIPQGDGEHLSRDPVSVDGAGAIRLVASVPDGALVRVMDGTPTTLVGAARVAADSARLDAGGALGGALVFDCVSRFTILGELLEAELAACQAGLGPDVPLFGCLTYGEVGAFGARMPQFHNKTMVVLALPAPR